MTLGSSQMQNNIIVSEFEFRKSLNRNQNSNIPDFNDENASQDTFTNYDLESASSAHFVKSVKESNFAKIFEKF